MNAIITIGGYASTAAIRAVMIAVFGFLIIASSAGELIAAPVNDNFANAQLITANVTTNSTNVGAFKQTNEPIHAKNFGGASVWFKFVAPSDGVLKLETLFDGPSFNTLLAVYTGDTIGGLVRLAENDDIIAFGYYSSSSTVTVGVGTGTTYYIVVDGKNPFDATGAETGPFRLENVFSPKASNDNFSTPTNLSVVSGTITTTSSNVGATKEAGEPNHMGNQGGRSVWFKYDHYMNYPRKVSFAVNSIHPSDSSPVAATFAIYEGTSMNSLTPILNSGSSPYITAERFTFLAQPDKIYYIAIDGYDSGQGADVGTFTLTYGTAKDEGMADFDKDGIADFTVFRPTTGTWYSIDSTTRNMRAIEWGKLDDRPMLHKDATESMIYTVYRPTTGKWFMTTGGPNYSEFAFGSDQDISLMRRTRDSTGRSSNNIAVFSTFSGTWWIRNSDGTYFGFQFGQFGDVPISADFDGDGNDEITVFRPDDGMWYMYDLVTGQYKYIPFGQLGDIPIVAEYDGDGIEDIAVFRPSNGTWYVLRSKDGGTHEVKFGQIGDVPQPADYYNGGSASYVVYRNGVWWLQHHPNAARAVRWGQTGDIPMTASRN